MFAKKDHLDNKHSVFGEVAEASLPVLDTIEKIPTGEAAATCARRRAYICLTRAQTCIRIGL